MATWEDMLLTKLGAPLSSTNRTALAEWSQSEGMPASANNPLAAEDRISGWKPTPGFSAPTYPSLDAATTLYADKLRSITYAAIGIDLQLGENLNVIYDAINSSPWCAGCQGGHYPIVLYTTLHGGTAPSQPPPHSTAATAGGAGAAGTYQFEQAWGRLTRTLAVTVPHRLRLSAAARARIEKAVR